MGRAMRCLLSSRYGEVIALALTFLAIPHVLVALYAHTATYRAR